MAKPGRRADANCWDVMSYSSQQVTSPSHADVHTSPERVVAPPRYQPRGRWAVEAGAHWVLLTTFPNRPLSLSLSPVVRVRPHAPLPAPSVAFAKKCYDLATERKAWYGAGSGSRLTGNENKIGLGSVQGGFEGDSTSVMDEFEADSRLVGNYFGKAKFEDGSIQTGYLFGARSRDSRGGFQTDSDLESDCTRV
ncbi:unnamed protein product, partial [Protopolystoma xenopodis]